VGCIPLDFISARFDAACGYSVSVFFTVTLGCDFLDILDLPLYVMAVTLLRGTSGRSPMIAFVQIHPESGKVALVTPLISVKDPFIKSLNLFSHCENLKADSVLPMMQERRAIGTSCKVRRVQ
jgi:hypothetical protein